MTPRRRTLITATRTTLALAAALGAAAAIGCERSDPPAATTTPPAAPSAASPAEGVTPKSAPADPGTAPQPANPPTPATSPAESTAAAAGAGAAVRESAEGVSWETPAGWSRGAAAQMRLATITDGTAEIRVSAFPGNVGGVLLNVNRWRGELGMQPVASDQEAEKSLTDVEVNGRKVRVADLTGPRGRTVVAMVPGDGRLYFFKMMAPPDVVEARKAAFDTLVKSIRVE